ncbi:uncharacterized protein B0I36DRAFT_387536 [Microdochium trichocladiopsis]|uniref:Uncharacterized protein n=1 Tax=Microdochium trichocladiopsis TaxID=1682393 RepID=A0A9P9BM84_9PEZI|nr:uncharacterized protein B0I36DRAFT_387536 [Microdochium trichocladiopsis]KAH7025225.1 hypothetical protein B0I36DRAFT_387536 [Microdochium trichocladiopsis]
MALRGGRESTSTTMNNIFLAIVTMCSPRILTRLGLQPRKQFPAKQKQPFVQALKNASTLLNHYNRAPATKFGYHCREVSKCITQWEKFQSPSTLAPVIVAIHKLHMEVDVENTLNGVTHQVLQKEAKASIVNKIRKLSRYYEIARYLCRRCIKDVAFRHLTAIRVVLPEQTIAYEPLTPGKFEAEIGFTEVLRQAGLPNGDEQKIIKTLYSLLKITPEQASQSFHKRVSKTLRAAKVHAEVKLLYYYEINRDTIPLLPRAVCSSKDACWMCNALIDAHGEMFTPRCHGVLYPGWKQPRLPDSSKWAEVRATLTSRLQQAVAESAQHILRSGQKPGYAHPVESTLSILRWSLSTMHLPLSGPVEDDLPEAPTHSGGTSLEDTSEKPNSIVTAIGLCAEQADGLSSIEPENNISLQLYQPYRYQPSTGDGNGLWLDAGGLTILLEPPDDANLRSNVPREKQSINLRKVPRLSYTTTYTCVNERGRVDDVTMPSSGPALMTLDRRMAKGVDLDMEEDECGIIRLGLSSGEAVQIQRHQ